MNMNHMPAISLHADQKPCQLISRRLVRLLVLPWMLGLFGSMLAGAATKPPNILFIIMDDVGIDQLKAFAPDAPHALVTPNIDKIIHGGVKFTNFWTMPECSPSRSCFFTGRYPLRTGVAAAILEYNLPSSHVSPYEVTVPRMLGNAGYSSALVGKYHLGGSTNSENTNPAGAGAPAQLGWDYFNGNLAGGPPFIDATLGGQISDKTRYPCGFPLGTDRGVCWIYNASGPPSLDNNSGLGYTGHECVAMGGIPALKADGSFALTIAEAVPFQPANSGTTAIPNFAALNGYYVWRQTICDGSAAPVSQINRTYMSTVNTDTAVDWVGQQSNSGQPWMCTVSYNTIHTPYQQPPPDLYPPGIIWTPEVLEGNQTTEQIKVVSNLILHAMDLEIGRLLVGLGLATRNGLGELVYQPETTDTMIVLVGDNGTYYPSVNLPYNPTRAKATVYQTGVTAPLVVAGPQVQTPDRTVTHMVNAVDLYALFGEIAGLDVRSIVPASHTLDCQSVMPYLVNPSQTSIRQYNFSQVGEGTKPESLQIWPSVFTIFGQKVCNDHLFNTQQLCEEAGGEWFGPPLTTAYPTSTAVQNYYAALDPPVTMAIVPLASFAIRDPLYKLVYSCPISCDLPGIYEFYDLQPNSNNTLGLDNSSVNLIASGAPPLSAQANLHYLDLTSQLTAMLASEPSRPGDGNLDKVVNLKDSQGTVYYWGLPSQPSVPRSASPSSVFDLNLDGATDQSDLDLVVANFGTNYQPATPPEFLVTTTADSGPGSATSRPECRFFRRVRYDHFCSRTLERGHRAAEPDSDQRCQWHRGD